MKGAFVVGTAVVGSAEGLPVFTNKEVEHKISIKHTKL